ncbi:MAG: vWA domain-containing protein [Hyphomicrobiaceae bacterium]
MIRRPEREYSNCQEVASSQWLVTMKLVNQHCRSFAYVALIALIALFAARTTRPLQAEPANTPPPTHVILMDSSGSMWGKFASQPQPKFLAAKDALAETIIQLPNQTPLGLVTFGRSCSGASVAIPPEAGTANSIIQRIGNLNPKSKGPIALALQRAANALPEDTAGSFVLIHDGPDNCRQDPCAVARDIAKRHPRLKINLISINLTPKAATAMQCVAKQTGGKVYAATNLASLNSAVANAFKNVVTSPQPELSGATKPGDSPAAPPSSTEEGPPGLQLSASLVKDGPALKSPLLWLVTKSGPDPNTEPTAVIAAEAESIVRRLDPGVYNITASVGLATGRATAIVNEKGTTSIRVALNAGQISFGAAEKNNQSGFVTVKPASNDGNPTKFNQKTWLGRSNAPPLITPSGTYRIVYEDGLLRSEKQARVEVGKTVNVDLATRSGELLLRAQTPAGTQITDISFQVRIDDPAATGGGRNVLRTRASTPTIHLPAGTYIVSAKTRNAQQSKRIVVGANANISETFTFQLGRISLSAKLLGAASQSNLPLAFRVMQGNGQAMREIARSSSRTPSFALPAGQYLVTVALGAGNVQASQQVTIGADENKTVALKLDAGSLTLARPQISRGPKYRDTLWEVVDQQGQVVWRTNQLRPTTLLAPGQYTVRNDAGNGVAEKVLQLASGAKEIIELGR